MPKIERDGVEIHYEDRGAGRPLVFLHGFLFNSEMWTPQIEELREEFRIITVDFRGHGRSSTVSRPFTLYDLVSDIVAVLGACEIQRATWVGLSMGGMVAMRAAIVSPETVEALVLLDTDAGSEDQLTRWRYKAMAAGAGVLGIRPFLPIVRRLLFGETTREDKKALVGEWHARFLELDVPSVRQTLETIVRRDPLGPMLHEIDVPTLVIVGDEDRALPPDRSRGIAEGIRGSRLVIVPLAGHLSNLERPQVITGLIREFLRELPPVEPVSVPEAVKSSAIADAGESGPESDVELESPGSPDSALLGEDAPPEAGEGPSDSNGDAALHDVDPRLDTELPETSVPAVRPEASPLEDYVPPAAGDTSRSGAAEFMLPGGKKGRERRGKRRVAPSRKLYGRVGHVGILVVDISESGARIEHYNRRFATRSTITIELEWEGNTLTAECEVMSCRVHRFIPGEKGATVYQSGLLFRRMSQESSVALKELVSRLVTRGLAEQVANARGIGPVLQNDMPTFRSGVVSAGGRPREAGSEGPSRLIRGAESAEQAGYIRCKRVGPRWDRKWTTDPKQPPEGFTVLASENKLDIESLCETWDRGDDETRQFIRDCARASIGLEPREEEKPGPK